MSTQVQRRKGTTAQHASFTGASAELTVDTTKNTVIVHDGATAGGIPLAKETGSAISATSLSGPLTGTVGATTANTGNFTDLTFSGTGTFSGGTANGVPYLNGSKVITTGTALTFDGTKLYVQGSAAGTSATFTDATNSTLNITHAAGGLVYFRDGGSNRQIGLNDQYLTFFTANAEQMRLTSTGLGIGTATPAYKLEVIGSARISSKLLLDTGSAALPSLTFDGWTNTGIYNPAGNSIGFSVNGSERARIDSSGNLGIGTSSPNVKLHVSGTSTTAEIRVQSSSTVPAVSFYSDSAFATTRNWAIAGSFNAFGDLVFQQSNALGGNPLTAGTTRMTLDASGNLLVGSTTLSYANANNVMVQPQYGRIYYQHNSSTPSGTAYAEFIYNGGVIGSITQNGTTGVLYNINSDYRLKNITGPITTSGAYIDSLKPVEGTWKADGSTFVGLIAHETQEVSRTTVATGTKDGADMQGMDYSSAEIIANLIAEIQSLRKRVAALEPEPFASYEQFGIPKP